MSSILTAVFDATIGWLVNKSRHVAAEKLKEGDVTDQRIRDLIIREVQDIKMKLDGLSRRDLRPTLVYFEEGIMFLYQIGIDAKRSGEVSAADAKERSDIPLGSCLEEEHFNEMKKVTGAVETLCVENIKQADCDETFSQAKRCFEMAREKATEAFNDEALTTFDRITAIRYRVMATMFESAMETVETAGHTSTLSLKSALENTLPECEQCLKKLHSLPAVQSSFRVELEKDPRNIKGRFGKDERREIISTVCQINRAIYDVTSTVGKDAHVWAWTWPRVDTGEVKVDPLRDARVAKVLQKVGMEHCCVPSVPWSFGQDGEEEHKLRDPVGITTNSHGQFIIADNGDKTLKVFESNGKFHCSFNLQTDEADTKLDVADVATGVENSTFVLVRLKKPGTEEEVQVDDDQAALGWKFGLLKQHNEKRRRYGDRRGDTEGYEVQVFDTAGLFLHKFPVSGNSVSLTVSGSKVLVLSAINVVDVYEHNGERRSFSAGTGLARRLKRARDITAANGFVMVMDSDDSSVHLFTLEGKGFYKFNIEGSVAHDRCRIACHPAGPGKHVVVASGHELLYDQDWVAIFTTRGKLVRMIQLDEAIRGITVTMEGHIALALGHTVKVVI